MTWQALSEKLSFLTDQFDQLEDTREIEGKKRRVIAFTRVTYGISAQSITTFWDKMK